MDLLCKFETVLERDMDMLFLEEFVVSTEFLNIFTSKCGIVNAVVKSVEHSKRDVDGESDMTVIIEKEGICYGLLIENKIDARAMEKQFDRYLKRGETGKKNDEYNEFYVLIVAPEKYLKENKEAKKYEYKISYEECKIYFEQNQDDRKRFKWFQVCQAIDNQKKGYQVVENKEVTEFWNKYITYQKDNYFNLPLISKEGSKGSNSVWIHFRSYISKLNIIHKANKGVVDLEIMHNAENLAEIEDLLGSIINLEKLRVFIHKTNKSAVLRINVPKLDLKKSFESQMIEIEKCFEKIEKMYMISKMLVSIID